MIKWSMKWLHNTFLSFLLADSFGEKSCSKNCCTFLRTYAHGRSQVNHFINSFISNDPKRGTQLTRSSKNWTFFGPWWLSGLSSNQSSTDPGSNPARDCLGVALPFHIITRSALFYLKYWKTYTREIYKIEGLAYIKWLRPFGPLKSGPSKIWISPVFGSPL